MIWLRRQGLIVGSATRTSRLTAQSGINQNYKFIQVVKNISPYTRHRHQTTKHTCQTRDISSRQAFKIYLPPIVVVIIVLVTNPIIIILIVPIVIVGCWRPCWPCRVASTGWCRSGWSRGGW